MDENYSFTVTFTFLKSDIEDFFKRAEEKDFKEGDWLKVCHNIEEMTYHMIDNNYKDTLHEAFQRVLKEQE